MSLIMEFRTYWNNTFDVRIRIVMHFMSPLSFVLSLPSPLFSVDCLAF